MEFIVRGGSRRAFGLPFLTLHRFEERKHLIMGNPNQPTPGSRGPNPGSTDPSRDPQGGQGNQGDAERGGQGGRSQTPQTSEGREGRKDDDTRRSGSDASGEMDAAGGGRKSSDNPSFDPSRSNRSGSGGISSGASTTTAPGRSSSVEPQKGAGEGNDDVERESPSSSERAKYKQQGC